MTQPGPSGPHSPAEDLEPVNRATNHTSSADLGELCARTTLDDIRHLAVIRVWPEAAELLGISKASAYRAAEEGQIPTLRIGRRILVPVPALLALLGEVSGSDGLTD